MDKDIKKWQDEYFAMENYVFIQGFLEESDYPVSKKVCDEGSSLL